MVISGRKYHHITGTEQKQKSQAFGDQAIAKHVNEEA